MGIGGQPDMGLTGEQFERYGPKPREKTRVSRAEHAGHVPQYDVPDDGQKGHVGVYLVAVECVGAEKCERYVTSERDERQQGSGQRDARREQVAVVVVVQ